MFVSVFMCFVVVMFFFVFMVKILFVYNVDLDGKFYVFGVFIFLGFFFWNLGDLMGRVVIMFFFLFCYRLKVLFVIVMGRWLFLLLYFLCNIGGWGVVVKSDLFYLVVV